MCSLTVRLVSSNILLLLLLPICVDLLSVKRLNVIGKGNFGTVYRAIWRGTLVAAKAVTLAQAVGTVAKEIETCR